MKRREILPIADGLLEKTDGGECLPWKAPSAMTDLGAVGSRTWAQATDKISVSITAPIDDEVQPRNPITRRAAVAILQQSPSPLGSSSSIKACKVIRNSLMD